MTIKIYTWKSGQTNTLCDSCADDMFFTLMNRVVKNNPGLTKDELQNLDSMKELDYMDQNSKELPFLFCNPIQKDELGNSVCLGLSQTIIKE